MTQLATAQTFSAEERRAYLGASEIAAAIGRDKYRTPLDLYNEKRGLVTPFEGNAHTERGNRLEAIAADYYTEKTGVKLRRHNGAFVSEKYPFIVGHVDRIAVGEKRLLEIKCPSVAAFRRLQREGLPESYIIQAQVYMHLSGYPMLTWCVFCADVWDAAIFDLAYDASLATAFIDAAAKFWNDDVLGGIAPLSSGEDVKALPEIAAVGGDVTVRSDPTFIEKTLALWEATTLKREAEELHELAKQDLINTLDGVCGAYECPGMARIYYTESAGRVTFDKKKLAAENPSLDLSRYEKQGKPFRSLRTYFESF